MPEESNHTRTTEQDRRSAHELALRVLTAASNLPKEVALLPGDEPVRESIVRDILDMESTYEPESAAPTTPLEGRWALRFASNGTVVTRPLAAAGSALSRASDVSSSSLPPGVTIEDIVQTISATPTTTRVTNEATVSVGPISFRIVAEGPWEVSPSASSPSSSESESKLYFDEARFRAHHRERIVSAEIYDVARARSTGNFFRQRCVLFCKGAAIGAICACGSDF